MRSLRVHGKGSHKYENVRVGFNGRLDTLQAAILLAKFDIFPEEIELRQHVAQRYTELLTPRSSLVTPSIPAELHSVWAQYSVRATDDQERSALQARLKEAGIPTAVYYPKPLHLQPAFAALAYTVGDFPISEQISQQIFSLPMHPYLEPEEQERIVEIVAEFLSNSK
jgi:dTDP-4-amino-4,6-dideoxygalactose transaminase